MTRSSTATPAPRTMPHNRCFGGNVRQAIAMTTALSPDRMMLTKMIWNTPIQNGACVMSCHKKSTANLYFSFSASLAVPGAAWSQTGPIYLFGSYLTSSTGTPRSTHNIIAAEKLGDLLHRRIRRIGAVHGVLADRLGVHLADCSGGRLGGIGRAHDVAVADNGVVAFQHLHHHRA